ncbi:hypothetical protein [Streptomyces sp. NPDC056543]
MSAFLDLLAAAVRVAAWWTAASILTATAYSLARTHQKHRSTR